MSTDPIDLWGDLPATSGAQTPVGLLRSQAELLTKKANGEVIGNVVSVRHSTEMFVYDFRIEIPGLQYSFHLIRLRYPPYGYPLTVEDYDGQRHECQDEATYHAALHELFTNPKTRSIVASLRAESVGAPQSDDIPF